MQPGRGHTSSHRRLEATSLHRHAPRLRFWMLSISYLARSQEIEISCGCDSYLTAGMQSELPNMSVTCTRAECKTKIYRRWLTSWVWDAELREMSRVARAGGAMEVFEMKTRGHFTRSSLLSRWGHVRLLSVSQILKRPSRRLQLELVATAGGDGRGMSLAGSRWHSGRSSRSPYIDS